MTDDQRPQPPRTGDERSTLTGFLDYQRATFAMKCEGLTTEQLRARILEPSGLSLLGLVRHIAEVERSWFRNILNGEDMRGFWGRPDGSFAEFDVETADPDEAFTIWRRECDHATELVAAAESLDVLGHYGEEVFSLRWILTHMIEEYARHNGHADLLREHLDGNTGE
ncbi:DinB family protein [Kitasatospora brasiliensis]|uniref:DinB family protein n=1 Tax=Kitasatospora brasiliensis TaxID=3058040 RepID=UPI002930FCA5|nr:DinB family protein [Kitasatospora sp. K002]